VTVGGHTDSTGFKQLNVVLSKERAQSTADLLVQLGKIDRKRIVEVKGFADDQKIVDTMLAEVRNRRVEIRMAP
jgi:outer membrane protein OmpA-like peptidoglycan-associated protein